MLQSDVAAKHLPDDVAKLIAALLALTVLGFVFVRVGPESTTTVAMGFLIVVLLVAAKASLWVAVTTSLAAVLAFNFFFLPPIGTLTIADPQNWIALLALLTVSLVGSNLSAVIRLGVGPGGELVCAAEGA